MPPGGGLGRDPRRDAGDPAPTRVRARPPRPAAGRSQPVRTGGHRLADRFAGPPPDRDEALGRSNRTRGGVRGPHRRGTHRTVLAPRILTAPAPISPAPTRRR